MPPAKNNPRNDRIKRDYLLYLTEAKQRAKSTAEQARSAIDRYEGYTGFKDFSTFNSDQAMGFKKHLVRARSKQSGQPISLSTIDHTLHVLREFFGWLCQRQGFRRIPPADIAYLSVSNKERREANAPRPKTQPTLEQIRATLKAMPVKTDMGKRDRALLAFTAATGIRDAALISLKLKHVFPAQRRVFQDPREVRTKFSKTIEVFFFPVGEDIIQIVLDWVKHLREDLLFGDNDPLFPKTAVGQNSFNGFQVAGLAKQHWANAAPVRDIFKRAFLGAGLAYYRPHSFRDMLVQLAYQLNLGPEYFKAWSQNLGHDGILTTFSSYGQVSSERQADLIRDAANDKTSDKLALDDNVMEQLAAMLAARIKANQ